ncbi:MAG: hypothetical protein IKB31_10295 [Bacteroidaceae bacterium]|nr:hypothetical protein [Bacteroidaceae bacterium]
MSYSVVAGQIEKMSDWVNYDGVLAKAFPFTQKQGTLSEFNIEGTIPEVSAGFNKGKKESPFGNVGLMVDRKVYSVDATPVYDGPYQTLGGNLVDEEFVPEEFFISETELPKWQYEKGAKKINRTSCPTSRARVCATSISSVLPVLVTKRKFIPKAKIRNHDWYSNLNIWKVFLNTKW